MKVGKRSSYDLIPRDFYPTRDPNAIVPPFLQEVSRGTYAEVCCGDGSLINLLDQHGVINQIACDIEPQGSYKMPCYRKDALTLEAHHLKNCDRIITNPPYTWDVFTSLLDHLKSVFKKPIWLLLPADWMHNKRMAPYMVECKQVISVGRLYWQENRVRGKDNYCWYQFIDGWDEPTVFKTKGGQ